MQYGARDTLERFLTAASSVKRVRVSGLSGEAAEASGIASLIRQRNLDTFTDTVCVGACTIAFLAGSKRHVGKAARLGFAQSPLANEDRLPVAKHDLRAMLRTVNVPDWFAGRALGASAAQPWYPTFEELLAARIIQAQPEGANQAGAPPRPPR